MSRTSARHRLLAVRSVTDTAPVSTQSPDSPEPSACRQEMLSYQSLRAPPPSALAALELFQAPAGIPGTRQSNTSYRAHRRLSELPVARHSSLQIHFSRKAESAARPVRCYDQNNFSRRMLRCAQIQTRCHAPARRLILSPRW